MKLILILLLFFVVTAELICLEIPFSSVPVKTDANLFDQLLRVNPDDKMPETLPTQAWLWYDEENLYAAMEARIDSTFSVGKYAPRDESSGCDYLYIYLFPNPGSYSCCYYAATPTNILEDGSMDKYKMASCDWNSSYSYTSEITDSTWSVVFKIPFRDLRFATDPPYKWKIRFSRNYYQETHEYSYPYYKFRETKDFFDKAADIVMTHKIKKQSNWKFRPYYVKSYDLVNQTTTYDPDNVGLDISFNPNSRTKMKVALNPDFTDVPPDDAQDIYNEKYPVYYSENRFFFIEDIDAFGVDYDYFDTRNIVQPEFAVKLTGTAGTETYGYLCAKDMAVPQGGSGDFYQLMAAKKQEPRYTIHFANGSRMKQDYYNHFIVGDWDWEFIKDIHVGASHLVSFLNTEDEYTGENIDKQGLYQGAYLDLYPGNWNITASYTNLQKDVALDTGYLYETGYESYYLSTNWQADPKQRLIRTISVITGFGYGNKLKPDHPFDHIGGNASIIIGFLPKFSSYVVLNRNRSVYQTKEHDTYSGLWLASLNKWPVFRPTIRWQTGKTIIYIMNETRKFNNLTFNCSGSIKRSLSWSANVTHYDYDYPETIYIGSPEIPIKLDNSYEIANCSLDYNFSNRVSIDNGLGIDTYKRAGSWSRLTFYSNFRYELKKDWFIYLGYKTGQSQDEPSTQNDLLGHFNRNSASAYLKLSLTI
jgi:hypothetical protein